MRISDCGSDVSLPICGCAFLVRPQGADRDAGFQIENFAGDAVFTLVQIEHAYLSLFYRHCDFALCCHDFVPQPSYSDGMNKGVADIFEIDRKSVVSGRSVAVRIDVGGGGIIKKKKRRDKIK